MKVYLAADHAGYEMKEELLSFIKFLGHEVEDCGAYALDTLDDYPDFVHTAAAAVSTDPDESYAIILGGSGQGEAIVANRYKDVRAVVYYGGARDIITLSRQHNDANILSLGARFMTLDEAKEVVDTWLHTAFSHDERHMRRIEKIETTHE